MSIEKESDIIALKRIGKIVAETLDLMRREAKPGMTTRELDLIGAAFLNSHGARSAPQLCYNFPGATCISVNHEAAHGIPGSRALEPGDLVNVDVSAELDGYYADTGASFVLDPVSPALRDLCDATQEALAAAMKVARAGVKLNEIGRAVEKVAKDRGYTIIKNLCSHGVGRSLHEEPRVIPSFYDPRDTRMLTKNLVITIEPFLSTGAWSVSEAKDGWTLQTPPQFRSAQYEHSMIITDGDPIVLT